MESDKWLLIVSIGPIQDFINSGRRCQDLWYGSELLSGVALAGARWLTGQDATSMVFPAGVLAEDADQRGGVANRLVALVAGDKARAQAVGEGAAEAVRAELERLRTEAWKNLGAGGQKHVAEAVFVAQVGDLLEVPWAAVPQRGDDYPGAWRDAEALLNARKATRTWTQPPWEAPVYRSRVVPKGAFDGGRESVLDERLFERASSVSSDQLYRWYRIHRTERLSGVDLMRRRGLIEDEAGDFFSTSHVAAQPFMRGVEVKAGEAFARYQAVLVKEAVFGPEIRSRALEVNGWGEQGCFQGADGSIFYEGRLSSLAEDCGVAPESAARAVREASKAQQEFLKRVEAKPGPYYCVLLADGDRMGAAIKAAQGVEAHQRISEALLAFVGEARGLVDQHHGKMVFSGGDDVLAFVALDQAVPCADALRRAFAERMRGFSTPHGAPTLSVGLGISHHLRPMGEALEAARAAERLAKGSRNALAVVLEKRGGVPVSVVGSWQAERGRPLHRRLGAFVGFLMKDLLPDGALYELEALGRLYLASDAQEQERNRARLASLLASETMRILRRKAPRGAEERAVSEPIFAALEEAGLDDPVRVASELLVAKELAAAVAVAKEEAASWLHS